MSFTHKDKKQDIYKAIVHWYYDKRVDRLFYNHQTFFLLMYF